MGPVRRSESCGAYRSLFLSDRVGEHRSACELCITEIRDHLQEEVLALTIVFRKDIRKAQQKENDMALKF
jgi:hypothetical protein